ncbi:EAL domain-containing protein [Kineosporia babensis]|uniref:EAL domain-containing protein n=1 Tax=Kineosporia babensis TaxID=499548 RepID=A0A9X1T3N8_9ACTN|nr:EAL domain-containing protein [Kineosporia babensis]MCD5315883.1 EAL domain-containing protein [Kineosporia babensis]
MHRKKLDWEAMLSGAIDAVGVQVVFQPIVDVARGTVAGYESLIRFPGYEVRNPETWFAAAHEAGVGADLQATALRLGLQARAQLPRNTFLSVNVGPEVLTDAAVRRVFAEAGRLEGVVVELTEHYDVDDLDGIQAELQRLREGGALIAVDDAGSGYAGLSRMLMLRPSMIKLDRELVSDLDHSEAKRALVEMVGTFAGRMDAWLLAEGIEREGELRALSSLGVPLAQGFYLGRPNPAWQGISEPAGRTLVEQPARSGPRTLRRLLEHPPVTRPDSPALSEEDVVVLCDQDSRPVGLLDSSAGPVPIAGLLINVDTDWSQAALRAITRPAGDWPAPLICTDNAGRYVGIVRIPRLIHALAGGKA